MVKCPLCKTTFEEGTKFCSKCGCSLEKEYLISSVCPVCGKRYPSGTRFCDVDGARLTTEDMFVAKCSICGKVYDAGIKFCPNDGGKVMTDYERMGVARQKQESGLIINKAPCGLRFIAYLLDGFFTSLMSLPAVIFLCIGLAQMESYYSSSSSTVCFMIAFLLFFIPIIYTFIKDGFNGQSLGRKAVGLAVINLADNSRCSKGRSTLRGLMTALVGILPLGTLIECIIVIVASDGRRIADKLANTQVVKL